MKTLISKIKKTVQTVAVFLVGAIVAAFGLVMMGLVAMFSLTMLVIGLIASPFLKRHVRKKMQEHQAMHRSRFSKTYDLPESEYERAAA